MSLSIIMGVGRLSLVVSRLAFRCRMLPSLTPVALVRVFASIAWETFVKGVAVAFGNTKRAGSAIWSLGVIFGMKRISFPQPPCKGRCKEDVIHMIPRGSCVHVFF